MTFTKKDRDKYYSTRRKWEANKRCRWTEKELLRLTDMSISDTDLAAELGRSVLAIQVRRCKLRKERHVPSKATPKKEDA